jgi:hypothetical protein
MRHAGQRPKAASASCAQRSSREHAVITARHLCPPLVTARSCARIDRQNLAMGSRDDATDQCREQPR